MDPEQQAIGDAAVAEIVRSVVQQADRRPRTLDVDVEPPPKRGLRALMAYLSTVMDPSYMSPGDRQVLENQQLRRARDEFARRQAMKRPLPPLYTSETAEMLTPEEIEEFGIEVGMNDGGMIPSYQQGGTTFPLDTAQFERQETFLSPEVAPFYAQLTDRIYNEGMRPYQPYGGRRLAGFTAPEQAAMRGVYSYGMGGGPAEMGMAQRSLMGAMSGYGGIGYEGTAGALDPYMSSYMQATIDPAIRDIRRESQRQMQSLGSQAGRAGAFGGYRHGLGEQALRLGTMEQIGDVTARGRQQAFQNAQQAFARDRAARMAAAQGLYGVGGGLASLGQQQQRMTFDRFGQMQNVGQQARNLQQQSLDIGYQDFQNRLNQERGNIGFALNALGQLPYRSTTMTTGGAGASGPSAGQRYMGALLSGAGVYNQFRNQQQPAGTDFKKTPTTYPAPSGSIPKGTSAGRPLPNALNTANPGFLNQNPATRSPLSMVPSQDTGVFNPQAAMLYQGPSSTGPVGFSDNPQIRARQNAQMKAQSGGMPSGQYKGV